MPLYDFTCEDCGATFEHLVRREPEIATLNCPKCHSARLHKGLSLPAQPVSSGSTTLPMGGGCGPGPSCGKPWCQRTG